MNDKEYQEWSSSRFWIASRTLERPSLLTDSSNLNKNKKYHRNVEFVHWYWEVHSKKPSRIFGQPVQLYYIISSFKLNS